jgi:hypothetical protein
MEQTNPKPQWRAMLGKRGRLAKNPAVCLAMLLLLAGGYFGSSREFGRFLFSIPILALLFFGAIIAVVWAETRKAERAGTLVTCVMICLTPLAYFFSYGLVQQMRFLFWAPPSLSSIGGGI